MPDIITTSIPIAELIELRAAKAELVELTAMFDRANLFTKQSSDGGKTWQPYPLKARVEMAIMTCLAPE